MLLLNHSLSHKSAIFREFDWEVEWLMTGLFYIVGHLVSLEILSLCVTSLWMRSVSTCLLTVSKIFWREVVMGLSHK